MKCEFCDRMIGVSEIYVDGEKHYLCTSHRKPYQDESDQKYPEFIVSDKKIIYEPETKIYKKGENTFSERGVSASEYFKKSDPTSQTKSEIFRLSEDDKIEIKENPEDFNKKTKHKRPFVFFEEMDIQKRAGRIRKIINWWKKGRSKRVVMVNMELRNGNHRSFIVYTSENGFKYNKAMYLFDNESSYYNVDFRFWCFDYHEGFVLPIKRNIPVKEIRDIITVESPEIQNAVNPNTISQFIDAEVAKGVMAGQVVWEFLRNARMIWIITMIIAIINFLLLLNLSGVFDKLKGG